MKPRERKHLIVGYGEVGRAINRVLGGGCYVVKSKNDKYFDVSITFDVVHICIPYSEDFEREVDYYKFISKLVIVHSSVPVGTCDKLGVVHSPIRGVHPHLAKGIKTFVKYFGGKSARKASTVFKERGIKTRVYGKAKTTEALKLWDTTQYGVLIMLEKQIHAWCRKNKVDFKAVYSEANKEYNRGYIELGRPEVVRPYLKHMKGPIGGHCVLPNARLLGVKL